jgi:hypothetical protein
VAYYAVKPRHSANRAAHAEDKPGAARFACAESNGHGHAHNISPRVPPAAFAFLNAPG